MWMRQTEYVRLCERVARLEEAVRLCAQGGPGARAKADGEASPHGETPRQAQQARRLMAQFENLLAYDGTAQREEDDDAEE